MPLYRENGPSYQPEDVHIHQMFEDLRSINDAFMGHVRQIKHREDPENSKFWKPQAQDAIIQSADLMRQNVLSESLFLNGDRNITFHSLDPSSAVLARAIWGPDVITKRVYELRMRTIWCGSDLPHEFDKFLPNKSDKVFMKGFQRVQIDPYYNILLTILQEMDLVQNLVATRM